MHTSGELSAEARFTTDPAIVSRQVHVVVVTEYRT